jgi:class 3 adenylate cyclase
METPKVKYAKSGDVHIAYQVVGSGPSDVVVSQGWVTHLGVMWENPLNDRFLRELAASARLIIFDKRGVGLSDRNVGIATLEQRMDDIRAVMESAGSKKAVLLGFYDGVPMSILYAAGYPERTRGLILVEGMAKALRAPDYPWGDTREEIERSIETIGHHWGTEEFIEGLTASFSPSRTNDAEYKRNLGRELSYGASRDAAVALTRMNSEIDVRSALSAIHVPTLVMDLGGHSGPLERGRHLAASISGARFVEIPGRDADVSANSEAAAVVVDSIRKFLGELPSSSETDRVLTTILFTDIVASTRHASVLKDDAWSRLLTRFYVGARTEVTRFRGRAIKTTGDGVLAIFDGPTRAIRCACALQNEARGLGLEIRAGLHTGECVLREGDVQGIAVHVARRVSERAQAGEVLVSGTVRELSIGSEVRFGDKGAHALKGVEGRWRTYSVENVEETAGRSP